MAGSLQRPPFQISSTYKKCNTSKYKSIIKLQKQRLLRTKGSHQKSDKNRSSHKNQQQLHQQLLKRLKYCQSLSLSNLLLLLPSSLLLPSYDSCRTAASESKQIDNRNLTQPAIKYAQQATQQQREQQPNEQQYQQQELQIFKKVFKSTKFCKNLLNRKKLQELQLRATELNKNNSLPEQFF